MYDLSATWRRLTLGFMIPLHAGIHLPFLYTYTINLRAGLQNPASFVFHPPTPPVLTLSANTDYPSTHEVKDTRSRITATIITDTASVQTMQTTTHPTLKTDPITKPHANLNPKPPCHNHLHHAHRCFLPFFTTASSSVNEVVKTAPASATLPHYALTPTIEHRSLRSAPPLSLVSFGDISFGSRQSSQSEGSWSSSSNTSPASRPNSSQSGSGVSENSSSTDGWMDGMISPRTHVPAPPVFGPIGTPSGRLHSHQIDCSRTQAKANAKAKRRRSRPAPITVFSPAAFMNRRARVLSYSPVDLGNLVGLGEDHLQNHLSPAPQTWTGGYENESTITSRKKSSIMHPPAFLLHTIEDLLASPPLTPAYVASLRGLGILPDPSPSTASSTISSSNGMSSGNAKADPSAYENLQAMWRGPTTAKGEESAAMSGISWYKEGSEESSPSSVYSSTIPPTPACVKGRRDVSNRPTNINEIEGLSHARKDSETLGPLSGTTIIQPRILPHQPTIKSGSGVAPRLGTSLAGVTAGSTPRTPRSRYVPRTPKTPRSAGVAEAEPSIKPRTPRTVPLASVADRRKMPGMTLGMLEISVGHQSPEGL
ncbi:hypothetical protein LTR86_005951 [Recurvomyces mirabilis]|nr:hypothetical protein LTR86_005951 [Recurvomyces mirabilis]